MNDSKYINISKLDAAKRQLEYAIKLFFRFGDVIVIHTLTAAASQVLRDLCKKQAIETVVYDEMMRMIKPEKKKLFPRIIRNAENFFKHADSDTNYQLKFYYQATEFHIWDACISYVRLTKENIPLFMLFNFWFFTKHNDILIDEEIKNKFIGITINFSPENRTQFLELLPMIEENLLK